MHKQPIPLSEFYKDEPTRENVKAYLLEFLRDEALKEVFDEMFIYKTGDKIKALSACGDLIVKAFDNMEELFAPQSKGKESVNEAR